jgi:hypothetical protein
LAVWGQAKGKGTAGVMQTQNTYQIRVTIQGSVRVYCAAEAIKVMENKQNQKVKRRKSTN